MSTGCLDDIIKAVNESSSSNVTQLVGTQNGDVIVPTFNCINRMHHFHFTSLAPGKVFVKDKIDDTERCINLAIYHYILCNSQMYIAFYRY